MLAASSPYSTTYSTLTATGITDIGGKFSVFPKHTTTMSMGEGVLKQHEKLHFALNKQHVLSFCVMFILNQLFNLKGQQCTLVSIGFFLISL